MRPSLLAFRIDDVEPAPTAAVYVARGIDLDAVGHAGLRCRPDRRRRDRFGAAACRSAPDRRRGYAAAPSGGRRAPSRRARMRYRWAQEIIDQERERGAVGRKAVDAGNGHVGLARRLGRGPRIGEVDRAVRFHHDVVRPVEGLALEARRQHRDAAVKLLAHDPPRPRLAGHQAALRVTGHAVRPVTFFDRRDRLPGRILPAPLVGAAKQQITALLPPQRSFEIGGAASLVAMSTIGSEISMIASSAGSSRSIFFPACAAASR